MKKVIFLIFSIFGFLKGKNEPSICEEFYVSTSLAIPHSNVILNGKLLDHYNSSHTIRKYVNRDENIYYIKYFHHLITVTPKKILTPLRNHSTHFQQIQPTSKSAQNLSKTTKEHGP